jgi:hypothetical protein
VSKICAPGKPLLNPLKTGDIDVLKVKAEPQINKSLCSTMGCGVVSFGVFI